MKVTAVNDVLKLKLEDYVEYTNQLVENIYEFDQVCSVYQLGGWSQPGISDIDLIIVTDDQGNKLLDLSKKILCGTLEQNYMLMHPPFVIPKSVFKYLQVFFYCSDLRLLRGEALEIEKISGEFKRDVELYKILSFLLHTFPRFNGSNNSLSLRSFLTFSYSLKHSYQILQDFDDNYKDHIIEDYIQKITELREESLEIPEDTLDITYLVNQGKEVCSRLTGSLHQKIKELTVLGEVKHRNIVYIKNHRNIFQFSHDFKNISSEQIANINILNLPLSFAVFLLLPIDKSIKFSSFQSKSINGEIDLETSQKLLNNLKKIKKLYNLYHLDYLKSNVINGMPLELNTTRIWEPKPLSSLNIKEALKFVLREIEYFKTKRVSKQLVTSIEI